MKLTISAAAVAAVAMLGGLGMASAPASGATAMQASAAPKTAVPASATGSGPSRYVVALEPGRKYGQVYWMTMGPQLNVSEGGPSGWIAGIRWFHWNRQSATGEGKFWIADAITWTEGHVSFRLYRPVGYVTINGHRHPYFTRLHIIGGRNHGSGFVHYWHWSWAAGMWVG